MSELSVKPTRRFGKSFFVVLNTSADPTRRQRRENFAECLVLQNFFIYL
jgi:hypothetical protein